MLHPSQSMLCRALGCLPCGPIRREVCTIQLGVWIRSWVPERQSKCLQNLAAMFSLHLDGPWERFPELSSGHSRPPRILCFRRQTDVCGRTRLFADLDVRPKVENCKYLFGIAASDSGPCRFRLKLLVASPFVAPAAVHGLLVP